MADGLFMLVLFLLPCVAASETVKSRCGVSISVTHTSTTDQRTFKRISIANASHLGAVCNDRSQGIYYIRKTTDRKKWIVYLEGGVGCGTLEECNHRYRERPELMMSRRYPATIRGRDIFDLDPAVNPDYWDYSMVLIPYCTSDLWIGNSSWDPARDNDEFVFNPLATYNQFAFRGSAVFRAVVRELLREGMGEAVDVVLVGSSAGGIGAMNQAGWLKLQLSGNTTFSVILDSAWFINFDGILAEKFDFVYASQSMNFLSHPPCNDGESVDYPCCVSAPCMLSKLHSARDLLDFPDVPVFVIFSQYDLFILSGALKKLENETDDVKHLESFRTITKYGVAMKVRLEDTSRRGWAKKKLSYFVPSCLQHVYLATSDLREVGGFLRKDENSSSHDTEINSGTKYFRSAIEPGMWSKTYIATGNNSVKVSLQCAIHEWNEHFRRSNAAKPVGYSDNCFGARCNPQCPESVLLGILDELWPETWKWIVVAGIVTVTVLCLSFKIIMMWKKRFLFREYRKFINSSGLKDDDSITLCLREEQIGIACLDLKYSVCLSHDAIERGREEEERRLAAEEQARELFGYALTSETKTETLNHPTKQGAIFDLIGSSAWTRLAGARTSAGNVLGDNGGLNGQSPSRNSNHFDGHVGAIQMEEINKSLIEKTILNGISSYFNPGQMVAIMGPSGSGKTTFLDLMTGRRREGRQTGEVLINGIPFEHLRKWYVKHSGYVLQLAVPYYEELTVRQNLLLAALMRLPKSMSPEMRFERVERIIQQIGLTIVEDTVVGGSTGPGLSGGQKRRLAVAIQLLGLPRVLFLDEPTSGLDATSSMELLQHLQCITTSGRLVILTIHQPRLEIFHMFDRILLLCQGEAAYYGSPMEAPTLFLKAYQVAKAGGDAPVLDHKQNPADLIMDMLSSESYRMAIMDYYKMTFKRKALKRAIHKSKRQLSSEEMDADNEKSDSGWTNRFLVLETRADLRAGFWESIYLPLIFFVFSLVAGLAYLRADSMLLIMAALSIYSYASSIFMFPPVYVHLNKALEIYRLERADGIGRSVELLLQTFMRYVAIAAIPLVICSVILCLLILSSSFWSFERFFDIALFTLALNQTWTSIAIMIVALFPVYGHKISPLVSCAAGFAGGFFIPPSRMKAYFGWLLYINPSYYGYAGMLRVVLPTIETGCNYQSTIECYPDTGAYWLEDFGMQDVQPYLSLVILLTMTVVAFLVAWAAIEIRYASFDLGALQYILTCKREKNRSTYSRVGDDGGEAVDGYCSESDSTSDTDDKLMVPRKAVPSIAISEPLEVANYNPGFGSEETDKEHAVLNRRRSTHGSRKSSPKSEETHDVFRADGPMTNRPNDSSESATPTLDGVRSRAARETVRKRDIMKSSMRLFSEMQHSLDTDVENLEAMNHDVPLRKLQRRITMRRRRGLSDDSEKKWNLQVPTIAEEQVAITTSGQFQDVVGAYETAL